MILQDVVDIACHSELGGLAIKEDKAAVVLFLNMGMIELYKRFPLNTEEHIVTLIEGTTLYSLPDNFMYPIAAYGETKETDPDEVAEIGINDSTDPYGIFFPNHKQVQIPDTATGAYISIMYVTKPPSYTVDDFAEQLDLSDTLVECLLHYIGYKGHLGVRGDAQSENNAHFFRFERSCDKARELGVAHIIDPLDMSGRITTRGFV